MASTNIKIGVIGAGKMGQMLLAAFIKAAPLIASMEIHLFASTSSEVSSKKLQSDPRFVNAVTFTSNDEILCVANLIFLCVRPHQISDISKSAPKSFEFFGTLISICAGISICKLSELFPNAASFVRCMPSITCRASSFASTGLFIMHSEQEDPKSSRDSVLIEKLLKPSGAIFWVKTNAEFDAATAIGASAPAFASIFLEGLADGAVSCGLSRVLAYEIVAQMVAGTAQLISEGYHPSIIKDLVSTPGGCTIEGVIDLEANSLRGTAAKSIQKTVWKLSQLSCNK
ncbi:hypothetical protein MDAP_002478 [Mitosporidium daphniae]|uniref:Pyrroline-5-carboxylate reductase n=1 Tax=Mitosporidium daphniae TaxID=1485682 RepID=A0A098VPX8_9MICR|nr:Pyrroline-5-carboxylate reductase [Mitosporidium daphniae]KGG51030.1 Pyrroline-5-carboxylate reductase [Mitosporidium daphniae]|eukprot:XP_013237481.1 Pyrroline-5-carboxylate reductase [Mitosporidium daphniae]